MIRSAEHCSDYMSITCIPWLYVSICKWFIVLYYNVMRCVDEAWKGQGCSENPTAVQNIQEQNKRAKQSSCLYPTDVQVYMQHQNIYTSYNVIVLYRYQKHRRVPPAPNSSALSASSLDSPSVLTPPPPTNPTWTLITGLTFCRTLCNCCILNPSSNSHQTFIIILIL